MSYQQTRAATEIHTDLYYISELYFLEDEGATLKTLCFFLEVLWEQHTVLIQGLFMQHCGPFKAAGRG